MSIHKTIPYLVIDLEAFRYKKQSRLVSLTGIIETVFKSVYCLLIHPQPFHKHAPQKIHLVSANQKQQFSNSYKTL